jgi:hypothetical protein
MNVLGRIVRMQDQSFDIRRVEMKHAGFPMINPDNGMIVRLAHGCVLYDVPEIRLVEMPANRSRDPVS